jgi:protocatechuate 3,4-dioxygenase beta subunit
MDNDDAQVGTLLTRREVLALLGLTGAALVARPRGAAAELPLARAMKTYAACVVRPAETEGPYFVDEKLNRSDIRTDPLNGKVSPGSPLLLGFAISRVTKNGCTPLAGAQVDVWHCDAAGVYSDAKDPSFTTTGHKYLRGYQVTDAAGRVGFKTIYPGWYEGRAVHIHFKIRTPASSRAHEFTSQIYFDDSFTDRVHKVAPYVKPGKRTRNEGDEIFADGTGKQLIVAVEPSGTGYTATFSIGLQIG